jgi:hypothetical protein
MDRADWGACDREGRHDCCSFDDKPRKGPGHRLFQALQVPRNHHLGEKGTIAINKLEKNVKVLRYFILIESFTTLSLKKKRYNNNGI